MMKFTYKGRSFSSAKAMTDAMQRDMRNSVEQKVRNAASLSGLSVRKTSKGLEVRGDAGKMSRFHDRLGR